MMSSQLTIMQQQPAYEKINYFESLPGVAFSLYSLDKIEKEIEKDVATVLCFNALPGIAQMLFANP